MKTQLLILGFFLMAQFSILHAQQPVPSGIHSYPIPSYKISVQGYADFEEGYSDFIPNQTEGKRMLNIESKPLSLGESECGITVWVYTLDRQTILGPYSLSCDDVLSVEIDDRSWGALVEADTEVFIDVWIDDGGNSPLRKVTAKHSGSF